MKQYIFVLLLLINSSCANRNDKYSEADEESNSKSEIENKSNIANIEVEKGLLKTVDYINDCPEMDLWIGAIQGVDKSDNFLLGQCFNVSQSYDLVLRIKVDSDSENQINLFKDHKKNIEQFFECFSFNVKLIKAKNPENEFDLYDYVYPQVVSSYKLLNGAWKKIGEKKINSFEKLGEFKVNTLKIK